MTPTIRALAPDDTEALIQMAWAAFAPIFASFRQVMGDEIYPVVVPDWKQTQKEAVEKYCKGADNMSTWVAEVDGIPAAMLVCVFNAEEKIGEVEFLMVHPDYQRQGIAAMLNEFALEQMRARNLEVATVGTGGDPGHAAARRAYEKAGYIPLPIVRYYKKL